MARVTNAPKPPQTADRRSHDTTPPPQPVIVATRAFDVPAKGERLIRDPGRTRGARSRRPTDPAYLEIREWEETIDGGAGTNMTFERATEPGVELQVRNTRTGSGYSYEGPDGSLKLGNVEAGDTLVVDVNGGRAERREVRVDPSVEGGRGKPLGILDIRLTGVVR